ncbi:MAG: helix-turn-helix domain containing protein [Caulobacter sp.]|nr:helix-turn-helix domain containing protein [Caulobacter sp.]
MEHDVRRETVLEAAATLFAQYGFRRTSLSEIAEAAGISRPTLYHLFDNKEVLFRQLANQRQNQAIEQAMAELADTAPLAERITRAILAYERIYYEPVADSPHGAEFMDLNQGAAMDDMIAGRNRLIGQLAGSLDVALVRGEIAFAAPHGGSRDFVELLILSINGMKKASGSISEFRQKIRDTCAIFMASLTPRTAS